MARVFISHASADKGRAQFLLEALNAAGHRVTFTSDLESSLPASEEWLDSIEQGVVSADLVIFWVTENWLRSCWCRLEFVLARRAGLDCLYFKDPRVRFDLVASKQVCPTTAPKRIATELALLFAGRSANLPEEDDPYPGFAAYEERQARFYSGREAVTFHLLSWINTYKQKTHAHAPLRALSGSSGVGKTSLLRAGLYAGLLAQQERLEVEIVKEGLLRRRKLAAATKQHPSLRIATAFDPTEDPFQSVRRCLGELLGLSPAEMVARDLAELQNEVIDGYASGDRGRARAAILIDAFERFYEPNSVLSESARAALHAVATRARVNVVFTIRSSALPQLVEDKTLRDRVYQQNVPEIDPEAIPEILERPAERNQWRVDSELTRAVAGYFRDHPQSLPLVAFVMRQIWQGRTRHIEAMRHRTLTRDLLSTLAGWAENDRGSPIDNVIEGLCDRLDKELDDGLTAALRDILFRMCRWYEVAGEVRSVGCKLRPGKSDEERLASILCSSNYRLMARERRTEREDEIVRLTHDRVLQIWRRAAEIIEELRPDLVLRAKIERMLLDARKTGLSFGAFIKTQTELDTKEIKAFFENWFDNLDGDLKKAWQEVVGRGDGHPESTVRTQRLLRAIAGQRAIVAGILSELKLREGDACQAVQIALAAPDLSPKGRPYKAVVTSLMRGLHDLRELDIWRVYERRDVRKSAWLFGVAWDEQSATISAFRGGTRILWNSTGDRTWLEILPNNHRAVLTLTDGAWVAIVSARDQTNLLIPETAVFIHHPQMAKAYRFNFGRKMVKAGALFEGNEALNLALAWEEDGESLARTPDDRIQRLGLGRLWKSNLRQDAETGETDFLRLAQPANTRKDAEIEALAWAGAGPRLFIGGAALSDTGAREGFGEVWNVNTTPDGLFLESLQGTIDPRHTKMVTSAAISRDGRLLITGGTDGRVVCHNLTGGTDQPRLLRNAARVGMGDDRAHDGIIQAIAISRDGGKAFTASTGTSIKVWDTTTAEQIAELIGHKASIRDLQVAPDGKRLFSVSMDGTVRSWDVFGKVPVGRPYVLNDRPVYVQHLTDSELLCLDSSGTVWRCGPGTRLAAVCNFDFRVSHACRVDREDCELTEAFLCRAGRGRLGIYNPSEKVPQQVITLPVAALGIESMPTGVCATAERTALLSLVDGRLLDVLVSPSGVPELRPHGTLPGKQPRVLLHLADGRVLCGTSDSKLCLWSYRERKLLDEYWLPTRVKRARMVAAVELPALGLVATAGAMGRSYTILLWETHTMRLWDRLEGHTGPVESLAVLGDQRTLVSGSRDCTVRFWDVIARIELSSIRAFPDWVTRIAVSPTGDMLAIAEGERRQPRVRRWGASPLHYRSIDWKQADGTYYSAPAFNCAENILQTLRPEGVPEETRRRYLLDSTERQDERSAEILTGEAETDEED